MKSIRDIEKRRFVACTNGLRLLSIQATTARRAPASESSTYLFFLPVVILRPGTSLFSQKPLPAKLTNLMNLKALRNFSRESSAAHNSN